MGLLQVLGLRPTKAMAAGQTAETAAQGVQSAGNMESGPGTAGDSPTQRNDPLQVAVDPPSSAPSPAPPPPSSGPAPQAAGKAGDPERDAYDKEREAVKKLLDGLSQHAQRLRIAVQIGQIAVKMTAAGTSASQAKWPQAMSELAAARLLCEQAKTLADAWSSYATKRLEVVATANALDGINDDQAKVIRADLTTADGLMATTPPGLSGALAKLDAVLAAQKTFFQRYVNTHKQVLVKLKAFDAQVQAFLKPEIDGGTQFVAQLEAALAASNWSAVVMHWRAAWDLLGPAERYGQRRRDYNAQRAITAAGVASVKAMPAVKARAAELDAGIQEADTLAGRETMKIEAGAARLREVASLAQALVALAPTVDVFNKEKVAAEKTLKALEAAPAKDALADQLKNARAQFDQALQLETTARAAASNPGSAWQAALTQLLRVKGDLAALVNTAGSLGPALNAEKAAAGQDAEKMKTALAALKADLSKAMNAPHADAAQKDFSEAKAQADATEAALKAKKKGDAAQALTAAAQALTRARELQAGRAQFAAELVLVENQGAALMQLPNAKVIVPALEAVSQAIQAAKAADKGGDHAGAMTAVRRAVDLIAKARQADGDRTKYNGLAKQASDRLPEITDKAQNKALADEIAKADGLADKLDFAGAEAAVKKVLVRIDKAKLDAGMAANPPDPKLRDIVRNMVANGGKGEVDAAIQAAPADKPQVITELASARFGKEFKIEGATPGANEVDSMKRCCEVFGKIDDDIVDNPSIKDIAHVDLPPGRAGGGYTSSNGHIGMEGRRGIKQKFGADEENYDPKQGKAVKALPPDIDKDCLPAKSGDEEYLGFAAAHEVGHAVDDRVGFMNKNGSGAAYGGWISHGADVQPIADAVGLKIAGQHAASQFNKSAESKKYMLDKLANRPAVRPPEADPTHPSCVKAESDAYDAFDRWHAIATSSNVYRRQGDCDTIQIGDRIYHEAYPRAWVSYLAAARKKGLTGYQFRAPAEWFAELYAGWKCGWLGEKHPALDWLKKL